MRRLIVKQAGVADVTRPGAQRSIWKWSLYRPSGPCAAQINADEPSLPRRRRVVMIGKAKRDVMRPTYHLRPSNRCAQSLEISASAHILRALGLVVVKEQAAGNAVAL